MRTKADSPLPIVSTIDALCSIISEEIFDGEWAPGEMLRENELTERFNVSRHSLREAFAILVEQGVLHKAAQKGVSVPVFTERDVIDIFDARKTIEEEGIRRIIASGKVSQQLDDSLKKLVPAGQNALRTEVFGIDMEFHWEIVKALDNRRLFSVYQNIITQIKLLNAQRKIFFPLEDIVYEHQQILRALHAFDEKQALEAYAVHCDHSLKRELNEMRRIHG